ncbi:MAG: hypothetical protein IMW98_03390 [Firmicutes bacterium]|nr:hypothetical protein [Bacillota bacterium]
MPRKEDPHATDVPASAKKKTRAARERNAQDTLPAPQAVLDPPLDVRREEVDRAGHLPGTQLEVPDVVALHKPRKFWPQHRG